MKYINFYQESLNISSYNLSETIESVQTSMSYQPVQIVMTREMEDEYYNQLIERVKQQSALEGVRYELLYKETNILYMRKQRHRSASQ